MFLFDLFRYCESHKNFTRQDLAGYVYSHRDCERLARHADITAKQFAACVAREFIPRLCTEGYLDMNRGLVWVKDKARRPFMFDLHSIDAKKSNYIRLMLNVGKMDDEEIFGEIDKQLS
jgi:hypothetical protein